MEKDKLRELIRKTEDSEVLDALWELYELKFMKKQNDYTTTFPYNGGTITLKDYNNIPTVPPNTVYCSCDDTVYNNSFATSESNARGKSIGKT